MTQHTKLLYVLIAVLVAVNVWSLWQCPMHCGHQLKAVLNSAFEPDYPPATPQPAQPAVSLRNTKPLTPDEWRRLDAAAGKRLQKSFELQTRCTKLDMAHMPLPAECK